MYIISEKADHDMITGKLPSNLKLSFKKQRKRLVKREIKKKRAEEGKEKNEKLLKRGKETEGRRR